MNSVLLQIATKYVKWILLVFAVIALIRGHNSPGGGFIGGLLVGLSVIFEKLVDTTKNINSKLWLQPEGYISLGLLFIILSTLPGIFLKQYFMAGVWTSIPIPFVGEFKIGTPFIFDIGVFMAVIGVTLMLFFTLTKISKWK